MNLKLFNFTLKNFSRMSQSVIGTIPLWGGGSPPVSTPFLPGSEKKGDVTPKSCFKSAENRALSSLWVVGHRYTRYLCASKLLWVYYVPKVEANPRPIRNLRKSLLFLKSLKTYQTSRSLGNYEGIDFATEKNCSVFSWPRKVSKSNNCFSTIEGLPIGFNYSKSCFF